MDSPEQISFSPAGVDPGDPSPSALVCYVMRPMTKVLNPLSHDLALGIKAFIKLHIVSTRSSPGGRHGNGSTIRAA
jgi:hypothetical protein